MQRVWAGEVAVEDDFQLRQFWLGLRLLPSRNYLVRLELDGKCWHLHFYTPSHPRASIKLRRIKVVSSQAFSS